MKLRSTAALALCAGVPFLFSCTSGEIVPHDTTSGTAGSSGKAGSTGTSGGAGVSGGGGTVGAGSGDTTGGGHPIATGQAGTVGSVGSGAAGVTGPAGGSGVGGSGVAGTTGSAGSSGRGATSGGAAGSSGAVVSTGTAGTAVPTGRGGATGSAGTTGGPETTGAAGTTGSAGTAGPLGRAGTTGTGGSGTVTTGRGGSSGSAGTGTAGTAGSSTGVAGRTGSTGTAGTTGTAGASGTAGAMGTAGASGTAGTSGGTGGAAATTTAGTIVPLYTDPTDASWPAIIEAKQAHPKVPVIAIVNPADGPGSSVSSGYTSGIAKLQAVNIQVIGYVATGYAANSLASVEGKIDQWKAFYPTLQGIFFDEQSNQAGDVAYYRTLSQYAKGKGLAYTVGNPGTDTAEAFVGALDTMLIYESDGVPSTAQMGGWHTKYPVSNFGVIPYATPWNASFVATARKYVGYIYLQNDDLPNPWDSLPPYFADLLAALE
jgi:hypothetical protein